MEQKAKQILQLVFFLIIFTMAERNEATANSAATSSKHFVLVHGSWHGAWCWYKIVPMLKSWGHNVTTIELAGSGINMEKADNLKSISEYMRPMIDFMGSLPSNERVILVGHSMGGSTLSKSMEMFPHKISVAVFVAAFMPGPSFNITTLYKELYSGGGLPDMDNTFTYADGPNNPPTTRRLGPIFLKTFFYQLSPIEDYTLATTLIRPQRRFKDEDLSRELVLTKEKYGSVRKVYVMSQEDLAIEKAFQLRMIEKNPPNEVHNILGSDHMVMMSKPKDLSAILLGIAKKYV